MSWTIMEIRIDTTKDSKEDIRKAIRLLESLADGSGATGSSSGMESFPSGDNVLGGFFDAPSSSSTTQTSPETSQAPIVSESPGDKKETRSKKFSIGSSGGFDVY